MVSGGHCGTGAARKENFYVATSGIDRGETELQRDAESRNLEPSSKTTPPKTTEEKMKRERKNQGSIGSFPRRRELQSRLYGKQERFSITGARRNLRNG